MAPSPVLCSSVIRVAGHTRRATSTNSFSKEFAGTRHIYVALAEPTAPNPKRGGNSFVRITYTARTPVRIFGTTYPKRSASAERGSTIATIESIEDFYLRSNLRVKITTETQARINNIVSTEMHRIIRERPPFFKIGDAERVTGEIVAAVDSQKSFSEAIAQNKEESNLDDPHFSGRTFDKKKDQKRLMKTMLSVFEYMSDEKWHTLPELYEKKNLFPTTAYRNIARLEQEEWGSHKVDRRRIADGGTWEYKLTINKDSLTYKYFLGSLSPQS